MLIDSHCHVDQFPKPEELVRGCEKNAIRVIAVTNLPSDFVVAADRLKESKYVSAALGMHPLMAAKAIREMPAFRRLIPQVDYVGEVGLDYSPEGVATKAVQDRLFDEVLHSLTDHHRFITLHSRRAESEVLNRLQANRIEGAVFHWFNGSTIVLDKIVEAGNFISINGAMLRSPNGIKLVQRVPREAVLVETDGPFAKIDNRPATPLDVMAVYEMLSQEKGWPLPELIDIVSANFTRAVGENFDKRARDNQP